MSKKLIENGGGCVISKNIFYHVGPLKWCVREESLNPCDNGWRFFSEIDDEEYLKDSNNLLVCDINTVAEIEPAILAIYNFPVGTDIMLVNDNGIKKFVDTETGVEI